MANIYLNEFDQWIEKMLIPDNTRGKRQKENPVYSRMNAEISKARKNGDIQTVHRLEVERRSVPSVDPYDESYRRCRYVQYADDFLIGFTGSKADAEKIKAEMHDFLKQELHLELSEEKTLITNASSQAAKFPGYEIKAQRVNDSINPKGRRGANGAIALLVPANVIENKCKSFMRNGNLQVVVKRPVKKPLAAAWGGISLIHKRKAVIEDKPYKVYGGRTELMKRLTSDTSELCGSREDIEVHHIHKLADLKTNGKSAPPVRVQIMAARQ